MKQTGRANSCPDTTRQKEIGVAEQTNISWSTSSWSPWIGCTEVSDGCKNCYARELDKRYKWGGATHWGAGVPRHRTKNWNAPLAWNKKAEATGQRWTVFPSLCDPFDNEVPVVWRHDFWKLIQETPNLTWLLLTKRIGNVAKMWPGIVEAPPPNVWLGASVVNQEEADRDIPKLLATPAAKRFVSYEPALGPVDFYPWLFGPRYPADGAFFEKGTPVCQGHGRPAPCCTGLDQIIIGGESSQGGAKARPFFVSWARSAANQCAAAGVPCFVKQLGSFPIERQGGALNWPKGTRWTPDDSGEHIEDWIKLRDRAGADPAEWPSDLQVQEFPAQAAK